MGNFKNYIINEWNFWNDFVVKWTLQPHKFPLALLAGAIGSVIGSGVGLGKGIVRTIKDRDAMGIPKEVGKGAVRWGTGVITQWGGVPSWAESVQPNELPVDLQKLWQELEQLATELKNGNQEVKDRLMQASGEFVSKIKSLPPELIQRLAQQLKI